MTNKSSIVVAILLALAMPLRTGAQELNWDQGVNLKRMMSGLSKKAPSVKATLVRAGSDEQVVSSPSSSPSPLYELEQATSEDGGIYFFSVAGNHAVDGAGNNIAVFAYYFDKHAYEDDQELNYMMENGVASLDFWSGLTDSQISEAQSDSENWTFDSNVAVYVAPNCSIDHIDSISVWVDPGGRIHSLDILRRQLEFRGWDLRHLVYDHFDLTAGRQNVFHIQAPAFTGIMDRNTLNIPLMKLEWRYDAVYRSFLASCGQVSASGCSGPPWPNELLTHWAGALETARGALDNLANLLASVPFSSPLAVDASVVPLENGDEYGGLSFPFPGFSRKELVGMAMGHLPQKDPTSPWGSTYAMANPPQNLPRPQCNDDQTSCLLALAPTPNESENQVAEFIDPRSLPSELIESIQEAQNNAEKAVEDAESLVPPKN